MLVLSRKIGEKIHVGDDVTIEIRRVAGNRVTIAVDAPRNVRILRGELKEAAHEFEVEEVECAPELAPLVVTHERLGGMTAMPHVLG